MSEDNQSAPIEVPEDGCIHDVGMLNLCYAKTKEDLANIKNIYDVGLILVPEHLAGYLGGLSISDVGAVVPVPADGKVNCMTGQVRLSADMLASGDPDTILVIAGQAFITGELKAVGYKEIRLVGQMFAPRSCETAISAKMTQLTGQNFYLPSNARLFHGDESIGKDFLELLDGAVSLVVMGQLTIEPDVTRELLKEKVTDIVLMGNLQGPADLVPLLQVLTSEKMGTISATE